jgi:hypothetical protein
MADNLKMKDARDDSKINMGQTYEVQYWTKKWGISEKILKEAVTSVGVQVEDVEKWLRRNGYI